MAAGGSAELTSEPGPDPAARARRTPRPVRELITTAVMLALFLLLSVGVLAAIKRTLDLREDRWLLDASVQTGMAAYREGRFDYAEKYLLRVVQARPWLAESLAERISVQIAVLPRLRACLRGKGADAYGAQTLGIIAAKTEALADSRGMSNASDYAQALLSLRSGDYPDAEERLRRDWVRRPDSADTAFLLGVVAERRDDSETAKAWYARVISLREDHLDAASAYLALIAATPDAQGGQPQ